MKSIPAAFAVVIGFLACAPGARAQAPAGRIFFETPETVAIYEFNEAPGLNPGDPIPEGTLIPDLSGQGLHATVEANGGGDLKVGAGDPFFDDPPGANLECQRTTFTGHGVRLAVNDDGDAFEMGPIDDFSIELYVDREVVEGSENWGILAGTWHSRNVLNDADNPNTLGAWYGYGLIRNDKLTNGPFEWSWVMSPVINDAPRIGLSGDSERHLAPFFDIPAGRHYIVLSVNRTDQTAIGYVDGVEVGRRPLDPAESYTTPAGYEHARFLMFSGQDDPTIGTFRGAPAGTHLDAVRVQRKALTPEEVVEIWDNIVAGEPSPPAPGGIKAAIFASATNAIVEQCVRLSGEGSFAGEGRTITKYEWKVADGPLEEGVAIREVSFGTVSDVGHEVTLRVTNDAAETSTAKVRIKVRQAPVVARILAFLGLRLMPGAFIIVPRGSVLTLDGTTSATQVPPGALRCPLAAAEPVPPSPITQYAWDLDGVAITTEDTRSSFDTQPFTTLGEFPIRLTVRNAAGLTGGTSLRVKVVDAEGNTTVFHDTPDTIVRFELTLGPEIPDGAPLPVGEVIPDLSGNGLDATVEANEAGDLIMNPGSPVYDNPSGANREIQRINYSSGLPRLAINDDGDAFEMAPADDFTIELFVDRETVTGSANWGILAGTWHSRNLIDDIGVPEELGAWYGYGLIRNDKVSNPPNEWTWVLSPVVDGIPRIGFVQNPEVQPFPYFNIPEGMHYVVLAVNRTDQTAIGYVDGLEVTRLVLDPSWSFTTPDGYEHARFLMFAGEDDPTRGEYRGSPAGTHLDAVRVQRVALTTEQVTANWENICSGLGADFSATPPQPRFVRGDVNGDGRINITDPIALLGFLFQGGTGPPCKDAADADDASRINITDPIYILAWLFQSGPAPRPPSPTNAAYTTGDCGLDPDGDADTVDCLSFPICP